MHISELYGKHKTDIYIIGSGATMDHFNTKFFEGKTVIALNMMYKYFPCQYMLSHHHNVVQDAIDYGVGAITSEYGTCIGTNAKHNFKGDYYYYNHTDQGYQNVDLTTFGQKVCAAGTPVVAALQVAYLMGATNIVLCGVDGGSLNDRRNYKEYEIPSQPGHPGRVQEVINKTANRVRQEGVGVYSVLPFVNMTLEGYKFKASTSDWHEYTEGEKDKLRKKGLL